MEGFFFSFQSKNYPRACGVWRYFLNKTGKSQEKKKVALRRKIFYFLIKAKVDFL
jgi:hypothetical protein